MRKISFNRNLDRIQLMLIAVFLCHGAIAIFLKDSQIVYWGVATLMYVSLFSLVTTYKLSFKLLKRKIMRIIFSIAMAVMSLYVTLAIECVILGVYIAKTS